MSCYTEYTVISYLQSKTKLSERIASLDLMIDAAILLLAENINGAAGNISSYELDDGQVRIKTGYRSITDIQNGIEALERTRNLYLNRLNGRVTILRDIRSIR